MIKVTKKKLDQGRLDELVANARVSQEEKERGYRDRALKMYPWVCGRCTREFTRDNLRELTVHHRNHDHDYNPEDGSNWELLCHFCHDNEHSKLEEQLQYGNSSNTDGARTEDTFNPFANLKDMLKK